MESLLRYRPYIVTSLVWLIILGLYVIYDRWPRAESILIETPVPTTTPTREMVVHVTGAVKTPGVYHLSPDARAEEAVTAAGGLSDEAAETFNLAAPLHDGQLVYVPAAGETPPPELNLDTAPIGSDTIPSSDHPVNLNTATAAQLEALPCLGPALAERVIAYREANGPFKSLEDIDLVKGIGSACIEKIRGLVTVQ
ncbi:MAG: helix-hairpin-helix domain-containing protein [Anaerolineae bacterium]